MHKGVSRVEGVSKVEGEEERAGKRRGHAPHCYDPTPATFEQCFLIKPLPLLSAMSNDHPPPAPPPVGAFSCSHPIL